MHQPAQGDQVIRDLLIMVETYARGMWRYRWRAVIVMWLLSILGWFAVYAMPPVYEASARIYVDTENAIRPLLQGIGTSSDVMSEVTVVTREMLSRPNLAEVARATDLDLRAETDEQFEDLLASLQDRISVIGNRDNIYRISFQDADRGKAVAVVDSLVTTFVEQSLGADRDEANQAQSFLQEQIAEYEARLTAAEERLAKFRRDNVAYMPDQRGDYFARLQSAQSELQATQSRLRLARERRGELIRQLEGEEPVFGIMSSQTPAAGGGGFAAAKIQQLEAELEELRLRYTDKHPKIGQILDTIKMLEEQQEEERASAAASGDGSTPVPASPLETNPVYQNMRIQLSNTEVEIASLNAEARGQQDEVNELKKLVDTVPQVEAELSRLNRDYDVVNSKYQQLLTQLETAKIGENAEASIDGVQFRIIDPPFAGLNPAGPQRQILLFVILVVTLGAGSALMLLFSLLHPVFFTGREVTRVAGLPVLGSVSLLMSPELIKAKRRSHWRFAMALGLLLISFTFVSIYADQLSPLFRDIAGMES